MPISRTAAEALRPRVYAGGSSFVIIGRTCRQMLDNTTTRPKFWPEVEHGVTKLWPKFRLGCRVARHGSGNPRIWQLDHGRLFFCEHSKNNLLPTLKVRASVRCYFHADRGCFAGFRYPLAALPAMQHRSARASILTGLVMKLDPPECMYRPKMACIAKFGQFAEIGRYTYVSVSELIRRIRIGATLLYGKSSVGL